jgi:hypothetical protein
MMYTCVKYQDKSPLNYQYTLKEKMEARKVEQVLRGGYPWKGGEYKKRVEDEYGGRYFVFTYENGTVGPVERKHEEERWKW